MAPRPSLATLAVLFAVLAAVAASAQEPGYVPGPGERGHQEAPGGEDAVLAGEAVAPAIDSRDAAWKPLYERYEDRGSVDCGGRRECQARGNETAGAPK